MTSKPLRTLLWTILLLIIIGGAYTLSRYWKTPETLQPAQNVREQPKEQKPTFLSSFPEKLRKIDSSLNIAPDQSFILVSAIKSNNGEQAVYSEIADCIDSLYADINAQNGNCALNKVDYYIYLKNLQTGKVIRLYSYSQDKGSSTVFEKLIPRAQAGGTELAQFPIAWSANDKYIITEWGNPFPTGSGGVPKYLTYTLNPATKAIRTLGTSDFIYGNGSTIVYAENNPVSSLKVCGPSQNNNQGMVVVKEIETGKMGVLLKDANTFFDLIGFDASSKTLRYAERKSDPSTGCVDFSQTEEKTITLP